MTEEEKTSKYNSSYYGENGENRKKGHLLKMVWKKKMHVRVSSYEKKNTHKSREKL